MCYTCAEVAVKIIIIYDDGTRKAALHLRSVLAETLHTGKKSSALSLSAPLSCADDELAAGLEDATHIVAVFDSRHEDAPIQGCDAPPKNFAFVAGFAAGRKCRLCYYDAYGKKAASEEQALLTYFINEADTYTKDEKKSSARTALLEAGLPPNNEWLCNSVSADDTAHVRLYFDAGFSVDSENEKGVPLLCLAARGACVNMARYLIDAGADVNKIAQDRGNSALIDAALGKHVKIIAALIAAGADVNVRNRDGQSALIISVGLGDKAAVKLLLQAGADADTPDSLGASARKYAQWFKNAAVIKLIDAVPVAKGSA
jgi:hypothetical protein